MPCPTMAVLRLIPPLLDHGIVLLRRDCFDLSRDYWGSAVLYEVQLLRHWVVKSSGRQIVKPLSRQGVKASSRQVIELLSYQAISS